MVKSRSALARGATLAFLLLAVLPTAAGAHPFVTDGATVAADSLTTMTLAMGHGCGDEDQGGGEPTLEVALEVADQVSYIEPMDTDTYRADLETDGDGRPSVAVWTAVDVGEAAPQLPMRIVIDGEAGEELHLKVFQSCDGFQYRWVGTPEDPASDPAVEVTLGPPDPDAPPPPAQPDPAPADGEPGTDAPVSPDPGQDPTAPTEQDAAGPRGEDVPPSGQDLEAGADEPSSSVPWPSITLITLIVATLLLAGWRRATTSRTDDR